MPTARTGYSPQAMKIPVTRSNGAFGAMDEATVRTTLPPSAAMQAISSVHSVEGSVRSLVHSATRTGIMVVSRTEHFRG